MNRLSEFRREIWGLERILFSNRPVEPLFLPRVFTARERELDRAFVTVFDAPRNLLLNGLFGVGKTIFIEALLNDLQTNRPGEVLCVMECLDQPDSDLPTTILRGLAQALQTEDDEARDIHRLLTGVELMIQQADKGARAGEISVPGILKIGGSGESARTESLTRKLVPNAAYQVRGLIERATARMPERRLIVAIDDLDKRDPETVRENLAEARSTLHTDCSFIFTGHPLSILRDAYSSVGGIFDLQLELEVLPPEAMRQLMINYLEAGRSEDAPERDLFPFTEEAALAIIQRAFGIPRVLNMICLHVLQEAGESRRPKVDMDTLRECWQQAGDRLKRAISADVRSLLDVLGSQAGGFDPTQATDEVFDRLGVDSYRDLVTKCNSVMREDWIVGIESGGKSHFLPQPLLQAPPDTKTEAENFAEQPPDGNQ